MIDAFSKKAWVRPIKDKSADSVVKALKSILREIKDPPIRFIWGDAGKEFVAKKVQDFLKERHIRYYYTFSKIKSTFIERFWRTYFALLQRFMTEKNTLRIVDVLQAFVANYNSSYHSRIGMAPNKVNKSNEMQIWHDMYKKLYNDTPVKKPKFSVDSLVRLSIEKGTFSKGYHSSFGSEIFRVTTVKPGNPNLYYLEDMNHEPISGSVYSQEISLADPVANEYKN